MRIYRTPLLKQFPEIPRSGRFSLILRRSLIIIPGLTTLIIWAILLHRHYFPEQGVWWVFYWLHDHVYLTGKGFLFNHSYPYSLPWWLLVLSVLVLVLGGFLLDRSFILAPHRYLLHWIFTHHFPYSEYIFLYSTAGLNRYGFQSRLLRRALRHEWFLVVDQLLRSPPERKRGHCCLVLARLTNWIVQIEAGFREIEPIELLSDWHWAYVLIRIEAAKSTAANQRSQESVCKSAAIRLFDTLPIVFSDFQYQEESWLEQPLLDNELFSIESLGRDICRLFYPLILTAHPDEGLIPLPFERFQKILSESDQRELLVRLINSVDKRRFALYDFAQRIDQEGKDTRASNNLQFLSILPSAPYVWQLMLSIALQTALDARISRIGTSFFEAQDAVIYALSLGSAQNRTDTDGWMHLISKFPRQEHYLAAASFRQLGINFEAAAFYRLVGWDKNLLDTPDLNLSQLSLNTLWDAGMGINED
jgi:hypothetical protein